MDREDRIVVRGCYVVLALFILIKLLEHLACTA